MSLEDAVNNLDYAVSLEEAGLKPTKEAEMDLRFPEYKMRTEWAMVESLSRRWPLLSALSSSDWKPKNLINHFTTH